jgi:hypothetical protein
MAVTHSTAARNLAADQVLALINAGTPPGKLVFLTAASVAVATCTFATASFGASASGTATAAAIADDTNAAGGTIAKFEMRNAAAAAVVLGSVTATGGGGDIEMNSLVVSAGQTVHVSSLTYTAMP